MHPRIQGPWRRPQGAHQVRARKPWQQGMPPRGEESGGRAAAQKVVPEPPQGAVWTVGESERAGQARPSSCPTTTTAHHHHSSLSLPARRRWWGYKETTWEPLSMLDQALEAYPLAPGLIL